MPLMECKLCRGIYTEGGRMGVCPKCLRRLGDLYAVVHEYLRDNEDEDFDVYHLADAMDVSPVDIQALIDLGYLERDLGLYGKHETARSRLAHAFSNEIDKMRRNKLTTYGGQIYSRGYGHDDLARTVRRR